MSMGGVGELIEAAAELMDEAFFAHAGDGGARNAFLRELGNAGHAPAFEQGKGAFLLGLWLGSHRREYDTNRRICQGYIRGLVSYLENKGSASSEGPAVGRHRP